MNELIIKGRAMLDFKVLYKKIGLRKIAHFIDPLLVKGEEFVFPKNSMLFWYKPTDIITPITKDYGYLKNAKRPQIHTVVDYAEPLVGAVREEKSKKSKFIKELKSKEKGFKFLKPNLKKVNLPVNTLFVFNLGCINAGYKYTSNPLNLYYKWYNSFNAMVSNITAKKSGNSRDKYILIDIPSSVPSLQEVELNLPKVSRRTLTTMFNYKYLNLLEIFKFMSTEYQKDSLLFKNIPVEEYTTINLLFSYNGNVVLVNLEELASVLDTNPVTTKMKKYKEKTVRKVLIIFFNKILESSPMNMTEVSDGDKKVPNVSGITNDIKDIDDIENIVNLDDMIENEISVKTDNDIDVEATIDENISSVEMKDVLEEVSSSDTNQDDFIEEDDFVIQKINNEVDGLLDNKLISKNEAARVKDVINNQDMLPSPYPGEKKRLGDLKRYTEDELTVTEKEVEITDNAVVFDKTMNKDTLNALNKKYLKETYRKDIINTIYGMQSASVLVDEHTVDINKNILGGTETHTIKLKALKGSSSTIRIVLPVIEEDGSFKMSGNVYKMRKQRADIPIRKISNTNIGLSTFYGKLFVTKATFKKDDYGFWFNKNLLAAYDTDSKLKDIVSVSVTNVDNELPILYSQVSRYTKSFKYSKTMYHFEYNTRQTLNENFDLEAIESGGGVLVGAEGDTPIVMSPDSRLFRYEKKKYVEVDGLLETINIDTTKAPMEYANVKIFKENLPVCLLLSYYMGFDKLLRTLKSKYRTFESGKREPLGSDEFMVRFKDVKYYIKKDYDKGDIILGGFKALEKHTKGLNKEAFNSKQLFNAVFASLQLPLLYTNEIKLMETMYIDPITKDILKRGKFPTTFKGVLIKSADMLVDDNYVNPNNLEGMVFKGYERIAGMLYKELVVNIRTSNNKSDFSKSKIEFNPYSVMNKITEDSTVVLNDDLNPIASLKQIEDVTYLGANGRSEATMSRSTREIHSSEIGIVSEGAKDAGSVGISALLSANPKLADTRGSKGKYDIKKDGWSATLSTSALNAPFGLQDDVKRLNFVNIQNSHVIPIKEMRAPYVRTGYESVIGVRSEDKFVTAAKMDGKVLKVTKENITVEYKDKTKEKIKLYEWNTKEESGSTYTHKLVTSFKAGEKFLKDDSLAYDKLFFEPDVFNKNRVIYKMGTSLRVAFMEDPQTYEDSAAISSKISDRLSTTVTKVKSIVLKATDNITNLVNVGDKVTPNTPLLTMFDSTVGDIENLDKKSLEILQDIKAATPKAKVNGKVNKIVVMYNEDLSECSRTVKKVIKASDEELIKSQGYEGRVNSSYSIEGKPLLEGQVQIKIYIDIKEGMGIGDKAIFGNQLKFTVGEVFDYDIHGEDGTEVEAVFGGRSVEARIVHSSAIIGTTSRLLEEVKNQAVQMYFE